MDLTQILLDVAAFAAICAGGMGLIVLCEMIGGRLAMRWRAKHQTVYDRLRDGDDTYG